jgi:hypothetical protein
MISQSISVRDVVARTMETLGFPIFHKGDIGMLLDTQDHRGCER